MKTQEINRYIDRKIVEQIKKGGSLGDVFQMLDERISTSRNSKKVRPVFRDYVIFYCEKRKGDLKRVYCKPRFAGMPISKLFRLVKLRDKLSNEPEITEII